MVPMGIRGACAVGLLLVLAATPVWSQYIDPVVVSTAGGGCSQPRLERDAADNLAHYFVCNGNGLFVSSLFDAGTATDISAATLTQNNGDLMTTFSGGLRFVYEQASLQAGATGNDIMTVVSTGGTFLTPLNITLTTSADHDPVLANNPADDYTIVWWRDSVSGSQEVFINRNLSGNQYLTNGVQPAGAVDYAGVTQVVFERDGELFHMSYGDTGPSAEVSLAVGTNLEALDLQATTFNTLIYRDGDALYFTHDESGSFAPPLLVTAGPIDGASLAFTDSGDIAVAYSEGGVVFVREGSIAGFGPTTEVSTGSIAARTPVVVIDSHGYVHVSYEDGAEIYYQNNVPAPTADFGADVVTGEILLQVQFENLSSGVFANALWDFGDGTTSTDDDPSHIYETIGPKTVSLTVTGPGGTSTETKVDFVTALPPTNILFLPWIHTFASQDVHHPVYATHSVDLQGFQLAMTYNHDLTPISEVAFSQTATGAEAPEFCFFEANPMGADSSFILSVVLDITEPFDGRVIEAGPNHILGTLEYTVPFGTSIGTSSAIVPTNGLNDPPINNIFSSGGFSTLPFLIGGGMEVTTLPTITFLRGDANNDMGIDISDAIFLLSYLFVSGPEAACRDSADANDTGVVDLADAIFLLSYAFSDGANPPYPFPFAGLDPTEDGLDCNP